MSAIKASPFSCTGQELMPVCMLSSQSCVILCNPRLLCPWDFPFPSKNPGVGCHFLLQEIFRTQGLNPHLLHWQVDSLQLSHPGSSPRTDTVNFNSCPESPKLLSENSLLPLLEVSVLSILL